MESPWPHHEVLGQEMITRQQAFDESLPYEGDCTGLRKHIMEVHGVVDPPPAGYCAGAWYTLASLHAERHQEEDQ